MASLSTSAFTMQETPSPHIFTGNPKETEITKCFQQVQRKREYNRKYYQTKVKPQKEKEKNELQQLRERCAQLEQNNMEKQYEQKMAKMVYQTQNLLDQNHQLEQENRALREALEISRQRNYELLLNNAEQYLPNISDSTLNQ
jgi:hypothetical protein